jgi:hypothetical protein
MADPATYCLGIELLGECTYKPASPYGVYFSLGEAISALAFTVAVQQLLKPIFLLRLDARLLSVGRLYIAVFVGALAVLISALVPHFPVLHSGPWGYPIVWEILAAVIFGSAYGIVIWTASRPATATPRTMVRFCGASARLLSSAAEADHIDYVPDLVSSVPALIKASQILQRRPETVTAFWEFAHRVEIERGSNAWNLLRVLADPHFCRTLVRRAPWAAAEMMREIDAQRLHSQAAEQFVREIAYQAVFDDDSMMAREVEYTGFGTAPFLSSSIFSSRYIVEGYDPFDWLFSRDRSLTQSTAKRFGAAVKAAVETLIGERVFHRVQALYSIHQYYKTMAQQLDGLQGITPRDYSFVFEVGDCFKLSASLAHRLERAVPPRLYLQLFARSRRDARTYDLLHTLVENVCEGFWGIANKYKGFNDVFWSMTINLQRQAFPMFSDEAVGMTPFQQQLAIKLLQKVRDNMNGHYPAVTRILLAWIGPYNQGGRQANRTAFNILRDGFYAELKSLRVLAARDPACIRDFLPDNVAYDVGTDTLVHSYSDGATASTSLRQLNHLIPLDLTHEANLHLEQPLPDGQ